MLHEELARFKDFIRDTAGNEARHDDGMIFNLEQRQHLRRLAGLGLLAHHPAIAAYCNISEEQRGHVTLCRPQQKAGSNLKELTSIT